MATTVVNPSDSIAVKLYSVALFRYALGESFWLKPKRFRGAEFIKRGGNQKRLYGTGGEYPIQVLRDLERSAGDKVSFDVFPDLKGDGVYGDSLIKGKEKDLTWFTDELFIDQVRQAVSAGGRMSRKRTKHDLRTQARLSLERWFARYFDEVITCYLAGRRGINTNQWVLPTTWNGFAGNPLQPSDAEHSLTVNSTGGISNNPADATTLKLSWFDKIDTYLSTMDTPPNPIMVDGEPCYIVVLHPKAVEQLRTDASANNWIDIMKSAGARGDSNYIFTDSLGRYGRFILYKYSKIPVFTQGSKTLANCLILGTQAAAVAFGDAGGDFNMSWHEEYDDRGNLYVVTAGTIWGAKKIRFNSKDFGSCSLYVDIT